MIFHLLGRDLGEIEGFGSVADDPSRDLFAIFLTIICSEEFYREQAGSNDGFFYLRLRYFLLFPEPWNASDQKSPGSTPSERAETVRALLGSKEVRHRLERTIFSALGLKHFEFSATPHKSFYLETIFERATSLRSYIRSAINGLDSIEISRMRLEEILSGALFRKEPWRKRELRSFSSRVFHPGAALNIVASDLALLLLEECKNNNTATLAVGFDFDFRDTVLSHCLLSDFVRALHKDTPRLESDYHRIAAPLAGKIVEYWFDRFALDDPRTECKDFWARRLTYSDGICECLSLFLLSNVCIGLDRSGVFTYGEISGMPGCMVGKRARAADTKRVVTTSFFYWYDDIDAKSLIACPDSMKNDEGKDSLTVAPASRDDFTHQSKQWHKEELLDMTEAGINMVLPVSYIYPFSAPSYTPAEAPSETGARLSFANSGLRTFRRAWIELQQSGKSPAPVGLFYDTSTLNSDNRFKLKVDFRQRYGKAWFYESIRDFFSYLPQFMWATFDGLPIVFVYHPSFGSACDDGLYPYVRTRFQQDFGTDVYIVTAAEEEAPRVLNSGRLVPDADALLEKSGQSVLTDIIARHELFLSVRNDETAYKAMIARRLLPSEEAPLKVLEKFYRGPLSEPRERQEFVARLLRSDIFLFSLMQKWFKRYLRSKFDVSNAAHAELFDVVAQQLREKGDWLEALVQVVASDLFYSASGGTDDHYADWIYQSVVMKHPNDQCTPNYGSIHATTEGKAGFVVSLKAGSRTAALRSFFYRFEVREAIVSEWHYDYYGWYNPGPSNSSFYWSAAISPTIRGVASLGPGYDQSKLRHRGQLFMPRADGKTYSDIWEWILAMKPSPNIVHVESWNEFFEGTAICRSKEYGTQYIELTKKFATRFLALPD